MSETEAGGVDETIEPDAVMQQVVDKIMAPHRQMLSGIVGRTETALADEAETSYFALAL